MANSRWSLPLLAALGLAVPGPAPAADALLLAKPVRAKSDGIVGVDGRFAVRFRVLRVLAGDYPQKHLVRHVVAHTEADIFGIRRWTILLRGERTEVRPLVRMVCIGGEAADSPVLRSYRWVNVVERDSREKVFGDVVCSPFQDDDEALW